MRVSLNLWLAAVIVASALVSIAAAQTPKVKPPAPVAFDGSYVVPGLLDVLYKFDRKLIPDEHRVRAYYMGMFRAFNGSCGEPSSAFVTKTMLSYGFNEFRNVIRDPVREVPRVLADVLSGSSPQQGPAVLKEGLDDAALFTKRYGCQTPVFLHMRQNLWSVGQMRYQSGPGELPNDTRLIAMMSPAYRKTSGVAEPARRPVQWWTPYVGYWVGTAMNEQYGSQQVRLMLVDPTDPAVNGVPSWWFDRDKKDGDVWYDTPVQVSLTSKQGTFVFLSEPSTREARAAPNTQVVAASQDGKRMTGTITFQSRKGQQWSVELVKE